MTTPIGRRLYRLDTRPLKERESVQLLTPEQLQILVTDGWADINMVAFILQMRAGTILSWIRSGKIRASKGPGRRWFIPLNQFKSMFDVPSADIIISKAKRFGGVNAKRVPRSLRFLKKMYRQDTAREIYATNHPREKS